MSKPSLDLYPKIGRPDKQLGWTEVERLALVEPLARHALSMVRLRQWTSTHALIELVFALYEQKRLLFNAEIERRLNEPPRYIVLPKEGNDA